MSEVLENIILITIILGIIGIVVIPLLLNDLNQPQESDIVQESNTLLYTESVAGTGSMKPLIYKDMNLIMYDVNETEPLLCGHVYIYETNNKRIVHRLVYETTQGQLIFRGDNNVYDDDPINRSQVKSKVIGWNLK